MAKSVLNFAKNINFNQFPEKSAKKNKQLRIAVWMGIVIITSSTCIFSARERPQAPLKKCQNHKSVLNSLQVENTVLVHFSKVVELEKKQNLT